MATQIITVPADAPYELNRSPFLPQNPARFESAETVTVFGVLLPGKDARNGHYQRFVGPGPGSDPEDPQDAVFTEDEIVNLRNAHDDDGEVALVGAENLLVIVMVNGQLYTRATSNAGAPAAGSFTCHADGGNDGKMTLTFGEVIDPDQTIEIFLVDADDVTETELVAGVPKQAASPQVVFAGEDFTVSRLTQ